MRGEEKIDEAKLLNYEVLGYRVEKLPEKNGGISWAYRLTGKRGATYLLMRNQHDKTLMFAVSRSGACVALKGNSWFTDKNGKLEVISLLVTHYF